MCVAITESGNRLPVEVRRSDYRQLIFICIFKYILYSEKKKKFQIYGVHDSIFQLSKTNHARSI